MKYKKWGVVWNHIVWDWETQWDEMSHDAPQTYSNEPSRYTKSASDVGGYRGMAMDF